VNRFPLATGPEDIPDPIDHVAVVRPWASRPTFLGWLRQVLFDSAPQRAWDMKKIDILWLCVTLIFVDNAPRWKMFLSKNNSPRGASFFQVNLFFG
jgi:hypothetical protein